MEGSRYTMEGAMSYVRASGYYNYSKNYYGATSYMDDYLDDTISEPEPDRYYNARPPPSSSAAGAMPILPFAQSILEKDQRDQFLKFIDVQQFKPNELCVRVKKDKIEIECKHGDNEDEHGSVLREFKRTYTLPEEFDGKDVISMLSSDGVLMIYAPKKGSNDDILVPQLRTGPVHALLEKSIINKKREDEKDVETKAITQ